MQNQSSPFGNRYDRNSTTLPDIVVEQTGKSKFIYLII